MKTTNYRFNTTAHYFNQEVLKDLSDAITTSKMDGVDLNESDIVLAKCIIVDLKSIGVTESDYSDSIYINKKKHFKDYPDTIIGDYMESLGVTCDYDSPLSDEYLKSINIKSDKKDNHHCHNNHCNCHNNNDGNKTNDEPSQQNPKTKDKVIHIDKSSCTLLGDGSIAEAQVDDAIKHWFKLHNINIRDRVAFESFIMKLRTLIPTLEKLESGKHIPYQVSKYSSPTNFTLAGIGRGVQVSVDGNNVSITEN